ncbi:MAG: hypothetical protein U0354_09835 [Candidatus Sericytochromatia bacterium]
MKSHARKKASHNMLYMTDMASTLWCKHTFANPSYTAIRYVTVVYKNKLVF